MFCRKCGCQIPDDSEFCPKCGENLGSKSKVEKEEKEKTLGASEPLNSPYIYSKEEKKPGGWVVPALIICAIAYAILKLAGCMDVPGENTSKSAPVVVDEDALADKNCKTEQGFSNIFACRQAVRSGGYDPDQFVREKWNPHGKKIKGYGFCEGFTRRGASAQFKIHYDKDCNAKELWIWDNTLNDFKQVK